LKNRTFVAAALALALLAACAPAGGIGARGGNPFAPAGVDTSKTAVDGLLVWRSRPICAPPGNRA
jgi:hypothetical protein